MNIFENINALVSYGLKTNLIEEEDVIFIQNRLLEVFHLDGFESPEQSLNIPSVEEGELENILSQMLDYAFEHKLIDSNSVAYRDLFDTKIMGLLTPRPSYVIEKFMELYKVSPQKATDWYYKFSQDTDYIRRYRISKDLKWKTKTQYGELDITVNLSKPEKDPKAIAAARNQKNVKYPQCLLCMQNVGYAGRLNHAARQNHRIIPLKLAGSSYGMQYSPYVYYNEHCIVFNSNHTPMKINKNTFARLFDFVKIFPHYVIGSNADLPIVGGSILSHDHFQGGSYDFPMARAVVETKFSVRGFEDIESGILKWPMSVIRLRSYSSDRIVELADKILMSWRVYNDEEAFIFSDTNGELHNTITPIARKKNDFFEMDLVLRNNITSQEHPLGVFHPHAELHHIKKENIGLIEVMGLAVLPGRLKDELASLESYLCGQKSLDALRTDENLKKHYQWICELKAKYGSVSREQCQKILQDETGLVFEKVLEHAGVYKRTQEGKTAFMKFIKSLS